MLIDISRDGIESVSFNIGRYSSEIKIVMDHTQEAFPTRRNFLDEQKRIATIFNTDISHRNTLSSFHGIFNAETQAFFVDTAQILRDRGLISHDQFAICSEEINKMIERVRKEIEEEEEEHEEFRLNFKNEIEAHYQYADLERLSTKGVEIYKPLAKIQTIITMMSSYNENPKRISRNWVYLFHAEGSLDYILSILGDDEIDGIKSRLQKLRNGIATFLTKYEELLHEEVRKDIDSCAAWFQAYYRAYIRITRRELLHEEITTTPLPERLKVYLPKRFRLGK
ncbi:MAG: hypothetical protein MRY21_01700 [Simkaniaceae bacterium]|nr:hypothetical protein [Simkaniaceae bacterium]